jgi:hypothetical protein
LLERYLSSRLMVPVELGEADTEALRTPVDGAMASAVLGSCLHAFGKVRRGSAAQELVCSGAPSVRRPHRMEEQDEEESRSSDE